MKKTTLWQISVTASPLVEEVVASLMGELFGVPVSLFTLAETGLSTISIYVEDAAQVSAEGRQRLADGLQAMRRSGLDTGPLEVTVRRLARQDWAESWKRHFRPIRVGQSLLIRPSWSPVRPVKGQAEIVLDPGLSFGTGQHPTTRFCLGQLVRARQAGTRQSFLDIGTGSGILAIAAAKLGYGPVVAFDFDADAVRISRDNARGNGVGRQVRLAVQDLLLLPVTTRTRYDVVCANLIYDLLMPSVNAS